MGVKIPVPIQVNTLNNGAISSLPSNVAVEVPARVSGRGVEPIVTSSIPRKYSTKYYYQD